MMIGFLFLANDSSLSLSSFSLRATIALIPALLEPLLSIILTVSTLVTVYGLLIDMNLPHT